MCPNKSSGPDYSAWQAADNLAERNRDPPAKSPGGLQHGVTAAMAHLHGLGNQVIPLILAWGLRGLKCVQVSVCLYVYEVSINIQKYTWWTSE